MRGIFVAVIVGGGLIGCPTPSQPSSAAQRGTPPQADTLAQRGTPAQTGTPAQRGTTGDVTTGIQVQVGREFAVAVGQEAHVEGTSIVVKFRFVSADSRCPVDVQCVWAGNAVVRLSLSRAEGPGTEVGLNTMLNPKSVAFGGHNVRIVRLEPVRRAEKPIAAADYVATLEITAR